jgi:3-methylcrotonyl-CoA carboxylase alpha subunit
VTEAVSGLDLVSEQLRVAAGLPLRFGQEDVGLRGHALECRVYAEDPARGFLPSTGRLLLFEPPVGTGVRNDIGVETGDEVTPHYDPMLAKLIVSAPDREACVERALWALRRYAALGVVTNLPLLAAVLDASIFRAGEVTTDYLDRSLPELVDEAGLPDRALFAAAGWRLSAWNGGGRAEGRDPWRAGPWTAGGGGVELRYERAGAEVPVCAERADGEAWRLQGPNDELEARFERPGAASLLVREGAETWTAWVVETPEATHVALLGRAYELRAPRGLSVDSLGHSGAGGRGKDTLEAPMPGTVVKVAVREGDVVEAGQTLVVLEAMKMEHAIEAPHAGTVRRLRYGPGDQVQAGTVLAEVEE